jgi:pyrroline-5-carboxylate reductase
VSENSANKLSSPGLAEARIILFGCGRMGQALLGGWLASGVTPGWIQVLEPNPSESLQALASQHGVRLVTANEAEVADVLVLAVKPQNIASVVSHANFLLGEQSLILSIMAGVSITRLRKLFPTVVGVIRSMPNLAAMVGQAATVLVKDQGSTEKHIAIAEMLLGTVGTIEWLTREDLVDVATALSGSGPAFVYYFLECLTEAATQAGLPQPIATRLARAMLQGAGAILASSAEPPEHLRQRVSSPGGTTEAGLRALMTNELLQHLTNATIAAAVQRSKELGAA